MERRDVPESTYARSSRLRSSLNMSARFSCMITSLSYHENDIAPVSYQMSIVSRNFIQ